MIPFHSGLILEKVQALKINGHEWHEVQGLGGSGPDDRHFVVETDTTGETRIRFGDGVAGSRPPGGDLEIRATYRCSGSPPGTLEIQGTFNVKEKYSSVRIQSGRVELDADLNEPSEPIQRYCGVYRGIVASNDDPLGKMRLKMRIPEIFGTDISPWASPCVSCGSTAVPHVGDTVWILFEGGRRDYPVWIGVAIL
jgi:hypothetical protein